MGTLLTTGKFAISNIMANLPIRMTKDKFSDYVTKGLGIIGALLFSKAPWKNKEIENFNDEEEVA